MIEQVELSMCVAYFDQQNVHLVTMAGQNIVICIFLPYFNPILRQNESEKEERMLKKHKKCLFQKLVDSLMLVYHHKK